MKKADNPMHPAQRLGDAPRCTATAKATGCRCKGPAVKGWSVCRMHGAGGGAPCGPGNGAWRHGERSREAQKIKSAVASLARRSRLSVVEVSHRLGRNVT